MKNETTIKYRSLSGLFRITALTILVTISGCKKFVEVGTPPTQINSTVIFTNDATAISSVVGIYAQIVGSGTSFLNGAMSVYPGLSSDELHNNAPSTTYDPFSTNTLAANNATLQPLMWRPGYAYIYQANECIQGLSAAASLTPSLKSQLLGESKFIRALSYFYLTNLYGDVPLIISTDYGVNQTAPRTASEQVYQQMIADLTDAQTLLQPTYPSAGAARANKWAATALLARVYLYHKDWANAETQATAVINSGAYSMVSNLDQVFLAGSKEAILQIIPATTGNTAEGLAFIPASATVIPTFALNSGLATAFEANDARKTSWVRSNVISGTTYYYPYKYKVRSSSTQTEYNMVLRLAEQYLIRAEARAQQQNITGAASDVNLIRSRAGLTATTAADQASMLLAVEQERRIELFAEWGHRWFDLKRTGRLNTVLSTSKPTWQPNQALYPVPFVEIQRNPALIQNPGY